MKIVQVVPTVAFGDAIGNETIAIKKMLSDAGYQTELYADGVDKRLPSDTAKPVQKLKTSKDDIIIYHLATGTPLNYEMGRQNCRLFIRYHNITPSKFFKGYSTKLAALDEEGYAGARFLADKADHILAVSEYNLSDLRGMGYQCSADVVPILLALDDYKKKPNDGVIKKYTSDGYTNILFTGRIVPNKKHEDIIRAFYYYKKYFNEKSRLIFVGNESGMEKYYNRLKDYISLTGLEDVIFTGHIKFDEILAYYKIADLFLCLSEHEGFCVPLVEAMYFDVPVLAYDCCAVPDTLGGGGIVIDNKEPRYVAEWMNQIITDEKLRQEMKEAGRKRLTFLSRENVERMFLDCIKKQLK